LQSSGKKLDGKEKGRRTNKASSQTIISGKKKDFEKINIPSHRESAKKKKLGPKKKKKKLSPPRSSRKQKTIKRAATNRRRIPRASETECFLPSEPGENLCKRGGGRGGGGLSRKKRLSNPAKRARLKFRERRHKRESGRMRGVWRKSHTRNGEKREKDAGRKGKEGQNKKAANRNRTNKKVGGGRE